MNDADKITGGIALITGFLGGATGVVLLAMIGLVLGLGTIANIALRRK